MLWIESFVITVRVTKYNTFNGKLKYFKQEVPEDRSILANEADWKRRLFDSVRGKKIELGTTVRSQANRAIERELETTVAAT